MNMTYSSIGITAMMIGCWATWAEPPAPASTAGTPKIEFQSTEFDFGKANNGELVKHDFIFTNTGTATLQITDVKPGCGCTSSGKWDREVAPGHTGIIPLQFNSAGFGGSVSKPTTVTCNDTTRPSLLLTIKGTVVRPIDISPSMVTFQVPAEDQTNETKVVRIVNNGDEPLTLSDVQCTNASFRTEL